MNLILHDSETSRRSICIKFACDILKLNSGCKLNANNLLNEKKKRSNSTSLLATYAHKKIYILLSILNIVFFLFYDINLHRQNFVYLEFVKYQLSRRRSMQVFAKFNEYISAMQLFYIQACPNCLPVS